MAQRMSSMAINGDHSQWWSLLIWNLIWWNKTRHGFGFDTMALMVMLHHYLAGTFGLSICWFDYDFMVDYDLMTWIQRLGSIFDDLVWRLWFDYIDSMMMMMFTIMMHILTNNTLMPRFNSLRLASTGFTSRIDIIRWLSPSGLCFTSHREDVFITSWIFSNSQLAGTEWIVTSWTNPTWLKSIHMFVDIEYTLLVEYLTSLEDLCFVQLYL
jgi:hypothetical protein